MIDFLKSRFNDNLDKTALIWRDNEYSYRFLIRRIEFWKNEFEQNGITEGSTIAIYSGPNPDSISALLASIEKKLIISPISPDSKSKKKEFYDIAQIELEIQIIDEDKRIFTKFQTNADNDLYKQIRGNNSAGLVLFSSGTTGKSKAAVHDFNKLLKKYQKFGKDYRTLAFMLFDHIGGIDTLFYSLSNASSIALQEDRSPEAVCRTIEAHKVEVLPATPSFINLLVFSEAYKIFDLSSLKYVTYGAEIMPGATLTKAREIFPNARLLQKFGTTEVGTLRSKSESSDSLWVKIGGEGYKTRIENGKLQIKAESAMLGYLNAPDPFTPDGWFDTGDRVEVRGEYVKFLGRESEIINVGGEKAYPSEIENVIGELDFVEEVVVFGESNNIMGNIVCADIKPSSDISFDKKELKKIIKTHCEKNLERYKIPVKIRFVEDSMFSSRYKKIRMRKK